MKQNFTGVFSIQGKLAVENQVKGWRPFSEILIKEGGKEYRMWDPNRSKLGAAIVQGIREVPLEKGTTLVYLGSAHGFTCSFISSIIGENGIIYAVEFSDRCFREFIPITKKVGNIIPIHADARFPDRYGVFEKVDVVFCDIADTQQTQIAIMNCKQFLKPNGYLMLSIKSRSIDVVESPRKIVESEVKQIKDAGFEIVDWKMLDPYQKDHGFVVARKI